MKAEIKCEFTAVIKTSGSTSEQVLAWPRRVEVQSKQKVFMDPTKENEEFDTMKRHE